MKNETYEEFVEKFKPKKTTDDCYTPPDIYEIIMEYAVEKNEWQGRPVVRPFYPGGDFENFKYPTNCVVIDNPPFSILSKIVNWYNEKGIDYFLFAPVLTFFNLNTPCHIAADCRITYENGANVNTGFVSSKGALIETSRKLKRRIQQYYATKRMINNPKQKYTYPDNFMTGAKLNSLARHDVDIKITEGERVPTLYTASGKGRKVFGSGYKTNIDVSFLFDEIGIPTSAGEKLFYKGDNDG